MQIPKIDYYRCGFVPRYCAIRCPLLQQAHDIDGVVWCWCQMPLVMFGTRPLKMFRKDQCRCDENGNLYFGVEQ